MDRLPSYHGLPPGYPADIDPNSHDHVRGGGRHRVRHGSGGQALVSGGHPSTHFGKRPGWMMGQNPALGGDQGSYRIVHHREENEPAPTDTQPAHHGGKGKRSHNHPHSSNSRSLPGQRGYRQHTGDIGSGNIVPQQGEEKNVDLKAMHEGSPARLTIYRELRKFKRKKHGGRPIFSSTADEEADRTEPHLAESDVRDTLPDQQDADDSAFSPVATSSSIRE